MVTGLKNALHRQVYIYRNVHLHASRMMAITPNFLELTWGECPWMVSTLVPEPGLNLKHDDGMGKPKQERCLFKRHFTKYRVSPPTPSL